MLERVRRDPADLVDQAAEYREALEEVIQEVAAARVAERGGRSDDKRSEAAMEDRKRAGYF